MTAGVVTLVVALIALVIALVVRPGYTSTAQVFVAGADGQSAASSRARVGTYARLVQNDELLAKVRSDLKLTDPVSDLGDRVTGTPVAGTLLIDVHAEGDSPKAAQQLATAVVAQLGALIADIENGSASASEVLRTVAAPSVPTSRSGAPFGPALLIGIPLGLLLGLLAAVASAFRRRPVRDGADVSAVVDVPVLGEVPVMGPVMGPVVGSGTAPRDVEGFEELRDSVRFLGVDAPGAVIVLTSPERDGDAAEVALQLARSLAASGAPVLLVDADLRTGRASTLLGLDGVGLSEVVVGDADPADAVRRAEGQLAVLTSGQLPPNPGELSGSAALRRIFDGLREEYRTIVVSAPDLASCADAARLAGAGDGAVLVVRRGAISQHELRAASRRIAAEGGSLLGVVLGRKGRRSRGESAAPPRVVEQVAADDVDTPSYAAAGAAAAGLAGVLPAGVGPAGAVSGSTDESSEVHSETAAPDHEPWAIKETPDHPEPFWAAGVDEPTQATELGAFLDDEAPEATGEIDRTDRAEVVETPGPAAESTQALSMAEMAPLMTGDVADAELIEVSAQPAEDAPAETELPGVDTEFAEVEPGAHEDEMSSGVWAWPSSADAAEQADEEPAGSAEGPGDETEPDAGVPVWESVAVPQDQSENDPLAALVDGSGDDVASWEDAASDLRESKDAAVTEAVAEPLVETAHEPDAQAPDADPPADPGTVLETEPNTAWTSWSGAPAGEPVEQVEVEPAPAADWSPDQENPAAEEIDDAPATDNAEADDPADQADQADQGAEDSGTSEDGAEAHASTEPDALTDPEVPDDAAPAAWSPWATAHPVDETDHTADPDDLGPDDGVTAFAGTGTVADQEPVVEAVPDAALAEDEPDAVEDLQDDPVDEPWADAPQPEVPAGADAIETEVEPSAVEGSDVGEPDAEEPASVDPVLGDVTPTGTDEVPGVEVEDPWWTTRTYGEEGSPADSVESEPSAVDPTEGTDLTAGPEGPEPVEGPAEEPAHEPTEEPVPGPALVGWPDATQTDQTTEGPDTEPIEEPDEVAGDVPVAHVPSDETPDGHGEKDGDDTIANRVAAALASLREGKPERGFGSFRTAGQLAADSGEPSEDVAEPEPSPARGGSPWYSDAEAPDRPDSDVTDEAPAPEHHQPAALGADLTLPADQEPEEPAAAESTPAGETLDEPSAVEESAESPEPAWLQGGESTPDADESDEGESIEHDADEADDASEVPTDTTSPAPADTDATAAIAAYPWTDETPEAVAPEPGRQYPPGPGSFPPGPQSLAGTAPAVAAPEPEPGTGPSADAEPAPAAWATAPEAQPQGRSAGWFSRLVRAGAGTAEGDPLSAPYDPDADDEATPAFHETRHDLEDTMAALPPFAVEEYDDPDRYDVVEEPRSGSLLDSFLTADEDDDFEDDPDGDPDGDPAGETDDNSSGASMWRPKR